MDNAQQDVHWSTSYHQQSSSTHYPEGEYPSPVPSVSSSYAVPQHHSDSASLSFEQVPSSVGPARVMTRRQRAAFEQKESHGRRSTSVARSPSRAAYQSPAPDSPQTHRQRLSMSLPGPPQMLPPYPLTPDSSTTPYSPSALPYYHHSRSASSHSHPRSASPALSTITTTSSVSATSNAQTFATFPPPMDVAKPKQRKQRLFNLDRKAICEFHRDNPAARQEDIAAQYGVERSTISKILKHKIKWLSIPDGEDMRIAKHRPSKFPNIESHMMDWLADSETQKTTLSDMRLREKARDVARCLGVGEDRFKASSGWVENFKHRHGIRGGVWTGIGPKSNTKKAKAMGMGTFDTQEMIITVLPQAFDLEVKPEHIGLDGEVIPLEARWQAEQDAAAAAAAAAEQHQREHSSDSNHHHQSHTEHSPPLVLDLGQQQHILEHQQHHSPLEHHDQHQLQHHDHHEHEHMSSAQPMDQMEHFPQSVDGLLPTLYHDGRVVYQPISTPSDNPIPSMAEAEEHLNKLLLFFDAPSSEGSGILTPDERDALAQVKMTLFNAASGIRRS